MKTKIVGGVARMGWWIEFKLGLEVRCLMHFMCHLQSYEKIKRNKCPFYSMYTSSGWARIRTKKNFNAPLAFLRKLLFKEMGP